MATVQWICPHCGKVFGGSLKYSAMMGIYYAVCTHCKEIVNIVKGGK